MRTDDQRDRVIDELLFRVKSLEAEVARLKGEKIRHEEEAGDLIFEAPPPRRTPTAKTRPPTEDSFENIIGTRWIGRIGVVAILFGIAFFLKYSFENKLIGEAGRVMLGIVCGAAFIGAGEYLQKKRNMELYGHMLSGGGVAVLYLALYAAFGFYHLIPAALAAAGLVAVTAGGMALSVRYSAYSLAAIALLGGFLTPLILSTGENQPFTLFGYILLLDAGTMLLTRFRQWPSLVTASLFGTILHYFAWHAEFFEDTQRGLAFGISALFFVLYNLYIFFSEELPQHRETQQNATIIAASAAFFLLAFFAQQQWEKSAVAKGFTLALAAGETGLTGMMRLRQPAARLMIMAYGVVSAVLVVVATFVILEEGWITPALAAEMAAVGWLGVRHDHAPFRFTSYALAAIVAMRFVDDLGLQQGPLQRFIPLLNGRFLICAAAIAGFYVLLTGLMRHRERLMREEVPAITVGFILSQLMSLALLSAEVHDFFRFRTPGNELPWGASHHGYQLTLSVLWAVYASLLTAVGIFRRLRGARVFGILLLAVTVLKVFLLDLSELPTFYRIISFMVLGLLLLAVSYGYNRFKHFIFGEDRE